MPKMLAPETGSFIDSEPYIDLLIDLSHVYGFSHHLYDDGDMAYNKPDSYLTDMQSYAADYGSQKPLYMTEYAQNPTYDDAIYTAWHIHNCMVYERVRAYFYWSLFSYSSTDGVVVLDSNSTYIIRPAYYALKHYSCFTDPNWYVADVNANSSDLRITAFRNPGDTNAAIVIVNVSKTNDASLSLSLEHFTTLSSEVYQTRTDANWVSLGAFNPSQSLLCPKWSITTIHLVGPSTCADVLAHGYGFASDIYGPAGQSDCYVNFWDVYQMAQEWLKNDCAAHEDCYGADFHPEDGKVNFIDFSLFAPQWKQCNNPQDPNCTP